MIILEGIRRSGKSFTLEVLEKAYGGVFTFFKDEGMRLIRGSTIDIDDYAIGRDCAYAQLCSKTSFFERIVFDRQYISSYVYGQFYRNRYDKDFWVDHIKKVENIYGENKPKIIFLDLKKEDFERISEMNRSKDDLESSDISGYLKQYELYKDALSISKSSIFVMDSFKSKEYIEEFFRGVFTC
jgi:thymidylate kinase